MTSESEYKAIVNDNNTFRQYILQLLEKYPEIFPVEMKKGFSFHDWVISSKQQLPMRWIKLKENGEVYQLRPGAPTANTKWQPLAEHKVQASPDRTDIYSPVVGAVARAVFKLRQRIK